MVSLSASVPAEYYGVKVGGDTFGVPARLGGQQSVRFESRAGRVENLVVRTGDGVALFFGYGDGEVMHCRPADSYEMDAHNSCVLKRVHKDTAFCATVKIKLLL